MKLFVSALLLTTLSQTGITATLTHGSSFTISGSGFGTRTVDEDIFDDCSNALVSTLWNNANNATYSSSTIVEFQLISSWSNTSIQITGNVGDIPDGTAYLHVFTDSSDTPDTTETVTIGSGGGAIGAPRGVRLSPLQYQIL